MKRLVGYVLLMLVSLPLWATHQPEFSTAGFFRLENSAARCGGERF